MAFTWKGKRRKIKVVGTINIRRREAPNLWLNPETKSIDPKIRHAMLVSNKNVAIDGCMFLLIISQTFFSKSPIFPGIA